MESSDERTEADAPRVTLVQCPAWGALPPLGAATLKAYLVRAGIPTRCLDLNIEHYAEEHRAREHDESGAYGGPDPWGAEAYDTWAVDDDALTTRRTVRFKEGSVYNERPLPLDRWADAVLADRPAVVGFTVYTTSFATTLLLAQELRRRAPDTLIVLGGPQVARDQAGDAALLSAIPHVVVDGEGEAALVDLVRCVARGEIDPDDPASVARLAALPGTGALVDGQVAWGPTRPLLRPIDDLPFPDFGDLDWTRYPNPRLIPIMSSRGCVFDCAFCYETVYWRRFRTQSGTRIADEIAHQVAVHPLRDEVERDGGAFYFMFADSLVNGHLGGLRRFAELLIERELPVQWGGQATINSKMDEAFFERLAASGCTGLAFGLESGSTRVLSSMGKGFDIREAAAFMRRAHDAGVTVTVNVMVGYPTETTRDFVETLRFLARTRRWIYQVSNVTTTQIALGSDLHTHPERYGIVTHADGSWSSDAAGDDLTRDRRMLVLHLWLRLLRIPHQEIAPSHRRSLLRRRRRTTDDGGTWQMHERLGSGPRDERPAWHGEHPPQATIRAGIDGSVAVERWSGELPGPFDRDAIEAGGIDHLSALIVGTFGRGMTIDRPDPEDHEQIWISGVDAEGSLRLEVATVPIRDHDGRLVGARYDLAVQPLGSPVALGPRRG